MKITKPSDEVMFKLLKDSIEYDLSIVKFTNKEKKNLQKDLENIDQQLRKELSWFKENPKTTRCYTINNVSLITSGVDGKKKEFFYIYCLHVLPEHRSKGYGKLLLDKIKQEWRKHFFTLKLSLHVRQTNSSAIRFYEREGFYITKESGKSYEMIYKNK